MVSSARRLTAGELRGNPEVIPPFYFDQTASSKPGAIQSARKQCTALKQLSLQCAFALETPNAKISRAYFASAAFAC